MSKSFSKKIFLAALLLPAIFGFNASAQALSFSDTVNFNLELDDNNNSGITPFTSWSHNINDNLGSSLLADITILDASLTVTYTGINGSTAGELWSLTGLGNLLNNAGSSLFNLAPGVIADLQTDGILTISITENSTGRDKFTILSSVLSGNHQLNYVGPTDEEENPDPGTQPEIDLNTPSSPEPVTSVLFASGLGLAAFARRRRSSVE